MKLRGIDFGKVLGASGVQGFFGEGYSYHRLLRSFGLRFKLMTFVAKTTTLRPQRGNLPLQADGMTPKNWLPKCVIVKPCKGVVLNAIGLSGPGAKALFENERWQTRKEPFLISFMSVASSREERCQELIEFTALFRKNLPGFRAPVGLQINFSCPNVGLDPTQLTEEVLRALHIAGMLGIPLMPKFSVALPVEAAVKIAEHPCCDALCISNTVPWGQLSDEIDWKGLFGTDESPLKEFGGGGISGKPLLPLVEKWVRDARSLGLTKPINAGGGILSFPDAQQLFKAGANSIFIGSMALLRGWRVQRTTRAIHRRYS